MFIRGYSAVNQFHCIPKEGVPVDNVENPSTPSWPASQIWEPNRDYDADKEAEEQREVDLLCSVMPPTRLLPCFHNAV
jgi:hypothetical protein